MLRLQAQIFDNVLGHVRAMELNRAFSDEMIKFLQRATAALPEGKVWLA